MTARKRSFFLSCVGSIAEHYQVESDLLRPWLAVWEVVYGDGRQPEEKLHVRNDIDSLIKLTAIGRSVSRKESSLTVGGLRDAEAKGWREHAMVTKHVCGYLEEPTMCM